MSRPYAQHGVVLLQEMVKRSETNRKVLESILHELEYRSTNKAAELAEHVNSLLKGLGQPHTPQTEPIPDTSAPHARQDSPKESALSHEHKNVESPAKKESKTVAAVPQPTNLFSPATPLTKPEAEKLLGIKGDADWAAIEKARIQLVIPSVPLPHQEANEVERTATLKRIQRINEAYLALLHTRLF